MVDSQSHRKAVCSGSMNVFASPHPLQEGRKWEFNGHTQRLGHHATVQGSPSEGDLAPARSSPVRASVAPDGPKQRQGPELDPSVLPGLALRGSMLSSGWRVRGLTLMWRRSNGLCFSQHLL